MTVNKIIDRNGRLFGKISVIDVLVILLVIAMAFALHVKHNELEATGGTADTPITITMLVENQPLYMIDAVKPGDFVYDKERSSGGAIGEIKSVEVLPGSKVEKLTNGTFASLTNEDGCNLLLTIEGSGLISNGRFMLNRVYELGANASRTFYTGYALFTAKVTSIA